MLIKNEVTIEKKHHLPPFPIILENINLFTIILVTTALGSPPVVPKISSVNQWKLWKD